MLLARMNARVLIPALAAFAFAACSKSDDAKSSPPSTPESAEGEASGETAGAEAEEPAAEGDAGTAEAKGGDGDGAIPPRGDDADRASKNGRAEGAIGGVETVVTYGRPKVKGRTLWGELVPFDKVWRTGANEATTITFADDVTVESEPLPAGTYGLFTIPGEDTWTVIFNEQAEQWGAGNYDEAKDALRVEVEPASLESSVEELTFEIQDDRVAMRWGDTEVAFAVAAK